MDIKFKIKTWLMMKAMEHKRKKFPLDAQKTDRFELPKDADPRINNSHYFGANGLGGESLIMRVGRRNAPLAEIFVIYVAPDGHLYTTPQDHYPSEACPMRVECVEPEKHFKVWFEGELVDNETGEKLPCSYALDFHATLPIYDAMQHSDFRGMAEAFARPKWNREFFREAGGDTGVNKVKGEKIEGKKKNIAQRHYEQPGHFTGTMTLGNKVINIDMYGSRDRAFGNRDWNYMSDHVWLMVNNDKGETFDLSLVNFAKVEGVFCGYSNIGYDHHVSLTGYKIIQYDANDGKAPDVFIADCTFADGKTVRITARRDNNLYLTFDNGNYFFQESVGEVDFGGVKLRGSLEYGFNRDKSRWRIK